MDNALKDVSTNELQAELDQRQRLEEERAILKALPYTVEQVQYAQETRYRDMYDIYHREEWYTPIGYVLKSAGKTIKTKGGSCEDREVLEHLAAQLNTAYLRGQLGDDRPEGCDPLIEQAWLEGRVNIGEQTKEALKENDG